KTSMHSGESKWITGEHARADVQKLRSENQVIMTGSGTVLADNPSMTVRLKDVGTSPIRVVVDSQHQITDKTLNIFSKDASTQIFNTDNTKLDAVGKVSLRDVLLQLGKQGINTILLEAGPGLIGAMISHNLIDEFIIYTAPVLLGSDANSMAQLPITNMAHKINLDISDMRMIDKDMRITASIKS
ncbi:MAG: RibD family protein, partial [Candidatus Thioglobus sp.]|nr:RibD family protein [Candidatus Thioglobus sp.]